MLKAYIAYPAFQQYFSKYCNWVSLEDAEIVIFSGGEDINPAIYGEKNVSSYGVNQYRDQVEIDVFNAARALGKKMLGVCRGHQLLMALNGGKLVQNITPGHPGEHGVDVFVPEAPHLPYVNSLHHQGIRIQDVPKHITVTSAYGDIVESTVSQDAVTVQWHPEFYGDSGGDLFFDMVRDWLAKHE